MAMEKLQTSILYVEDNEIIRQTITYFLNNLVEKLIVASDGFEALERFLEFPIDIVITDIGMPGMSGLEMAREMRKIKPDIPIIVVTAYDDSDLLLDAIEIGINYYLVKPVKREKLIETVNKCFEIIALKSKLIQAENEILNMNSLLELRVQERTADLNHSLQKLEEEIVFRKQIEQELLNAKQIAEAANKTKDIFLANMSHELRTPLNGILGMSNLLAKTSLTDKQIEYLGYVKISANGLHKIINDILDISRIEAGKLSILNVAFNLSETIKFILTTKSFLPIDSVLKIVTEFDAFPPIVFGDEYRIKQVINNLLSNAFKFSNNKEIVFKIKVINVDYQNVELQFSVQDFGIGIAEYSKKLLFNTFSQIDSSFTRKYGGTGLGLAISKQLVEMMGGKIWVESEVNKGSTFYFSLSLGLIEEKHFSENSQSSDSYTSQSEIPEINNSDFKILLVEDDFINQKIVQEFLTINSFNIQSVSSGKEFLKVIENTVFDLILMDIQLKDYSGLELTDILRKKEKETATYTIIIALTAHASISDCEYFVSQGMDGYVTKPIDFDNFINIIKKYSKLKSDLNNSTDTNSDEEDDEQPAEIEFLLSKLKGNKILLNEIITYFLQTFSKSIEELETSLANSDFAKVKEISHKLVSTVGNFRAKKIVKYLQNIENLAKSEKSVEISEKIRLINTESKILITFLTNYNFEN